MKVLLWTYSDREQFFNHIKEPERRGLSLKSLSFDFTRPTKVANNRKLGSFIFLVIVEGDDQVYFLMK